MNILQTLLESTELDSLLKQLGVHDTSSKFARLVKSHASPEQITALTKCAKFKWKLSKIVYARDGRKLCSIAMYADGTAA